MDSLQDGILSLALTASEAAQKLGVVTKDAEAWAEQNRQCDELLGVWSNRHNAFVYPPFQLDSSVQLERLTQLLRILSTRTGFDPIQDDRGGWGRAYWLHQPHAQLSEAALRAIDLAQEDPVALSVTLSALDDTARAPAEVFVNHPNVVITMAADLAMATRATRPLEGL